MAPSLLGAGIKPGGLSGWVGYMLLLNPNSYLLMKKKYPSYRPKGRAVFCTEEAVKPTLWWDLY